MMVSSINMASNGSYSNDRPSVGCSDIDYASDPASGGFFNSDFKKHDDLKQMLDSNKDGLKLEAMKRIIGMVAKGRDASDLFPAVVKNVVSKNIEVKKLVYVYLVRYAEEQQDLALLSISSFQRALKDSNQLIRASALRVLSSIRVPVIVPIVMLAIKESVSDMSPYVRKTAAHAIPKLYNLDPVQKDELVLVIEKLLSDRTILVVGSAVMAFEEVCPERIDLIHKNYRKLCGLLVDVDEWGQVVIINMLTRYGRTQFINPQLLDGNKYEQFSEEKSFYDDEDNDIIENDKDVKEKLLYIDPDHKLLLRNAKPLLQSRNAAVVMSVAQLYHHLAPRMEVSVIAKSLVRLLRSHREVQSIVLNCIATISTERKGLFEPYLKSFFVLTGDPTHIKLLKLEILTNLATETSISIILREFQTYISNPDKEFVAAAIQAIGRCASNIKEVTDSCLTGLVSLLSNKDEAVVAESVIVIKKLLQSEPSKHKDIIKSMAKLIDTITVPAAKASILWVLGEYSNLVPTIAPDILRKMAQSFIDEEDIVKLQIMTLSVKLYLANPAQVMPLSMFVMHLAKFDKNYDIRDRARFFLPFLLPQSNKLVAAAHRIFLTSKPAPLLQSKFKDREAFQMGSLSQYLNMRATGYHDLPDFPDEAPDTSVRNVNVDSPPSPPNMELPVKNKKSSKNNTFYSDSESSFHEEGNSGSEVNDSHGDDDEDTEDDVDSSTDSSSENDSQSESESDEQNTNKDNEKKDLEKQIVAHLSEDSSAASSSDDSDSDSSEDSSQLEKKDKLKQSSNLDLLLELDDIVPNTPIMTPSLGGFLTPVPSSDSVVSSVDNKIKIAGPTNFPDKVEVLNKFSGGGLSVCARFTRQPHLYCSSMTSVELTFTNHSSSKSLSCITMKSVDGFNVHSFAPVTTLEPKSNALVTLGIDWKDSSKSVDIEICWNQGDAKFSLKPPLGELVRPVCMMGDLFSHHQNKLKGMHEHSCVLKCLFRPNEIAKSILDTANVASHPFKEPEILRFCGQTVSSNSLVLISVKASSETSTGEPFMEITVNCEHVVFGSVLLTEIKSAFNN